MCNHEDLFNGFFAERQHWIWISLVKTQKKQGAKYRLVLLTFMFLPNAFVDILNYNKNIQGKLMIILTCFAPV